MRRDQFARVHRRQRTRCFHRLIEMSRFMKKLVLVVLVVVEISSMALMEARPNEDQSSGTNQSQKCRSTPGAADHIVCQEVENLSELAEKISRRWRSIEVRNERALQFSMAVPTTTNLSRSLGGLEELDLSSVTKLDLGERDVRMFTMLRSLNVSECQLGVWDAAYFASTETLEVLDASWNNIRQLTIASMANLGSLRSANFSHNNLEAVQRGALEALSSLQYLDLSYNSLATVDLGPCPTLRHLLISDNSFKTIASLNFREMPALETLVLTSGYLEKIENRAFEGLPNLRLLNLSGNSLATLTPNTFDGLQRTNLKELDLSLNDIVELPALAFQHLPRLQNLNLSGNQLKRLTSEMFRGLTSLRKLYASNNDIAELGANTFDGLMALDTVDLSRNNFVALGHDAFSTVALPKLRKLLLGENNLRQLHPLALSALPYLEYLSLAFNELTALDVRMFAPLRRLRKLHLGHNLLEELPRDVLESLDSSIVELLLDNNRLTFLPNLPDADFPRLQRLMVEGNPWQCPCLQELMQWLDHKGVTYVHPKSPFYQGRQPLCVITASEVCVMDIALVRRYNVIGMYEL